ncbi:MAG: hypothetical protein N2039_02920 [Gemmataceae bacterium]|nr:hypothetical protein [Gemmataceae bacterium]
MLERRQVRVWLPTIIACLLGCGITFAQEKKETTAKRGQLPPNWSKLGLSEEQKAKVYSIQAEFKSKADEIKKQLEELQKQERKALEAVLTPSQKTRLREILLEKIPGASDGDKPDKSK